MYKTTRTFTRTRFQLIIAALFAPKNTLADTRYDKYVETRYENTDVIKERIVIGQPTAINVFRYSKHVPAVEGVSKASSEYGYALTPETAFELGKDYADTRQTTNTVTTYRALIIGGEYFLMSTINPTPISVTVS